MSLPPLPARLFEDRRFVVLNKPAGLPVHPGPRGGASVEDWFPLLSRRADGPWLAHRLDADTAGCLVVALRKAALIAAQGCFADGRAGKRYWAVVSGAPAASSGEIDAPLLKHSDRSGWRMRVDPSGQAARTRWQILGRAPGRAWLELELLSGRTHQARAHCAHLGLPILGDPVYGDGVGQAEGGGLHLLARSIALPLDPPVSAVAPPPPHMRDALERCGWSASAGP
ncbi:RNA pseudouridine synthase [Acetobacteraceae bacterium KSS8]|uniref:RNA pseudouridine synthase n=1 Tax=Endosaccharibacter trunci TaxID=2812733 RepID=A0ABT1W567_9PROT|nr:RNA pseudouridine synthase [Acetobacteraceae bacterium KSS8]